MPYSDIYAEDKNDTHVWDRYKSTYFKPNSENFWEYYQHENYKQSLVGRYKLHITIHPAKLRKVETQIHRVLHEAMKDGLITHYKVCNIDHADCRHTKENKRQLNAPFVIYLNDNYNAAYLSRIAELSNKIEQILCFTPAGDPSQRTGSDLLLTPHILFRQAYFNVDPKNTWQEINENYRDPEKHGERLRAEALESDYYKTFSALLIKTNYIIQVNHLIDVLVFYRTLLYAEQQRIFPKYGLSDPKYLALAEKIMSLDSQIFLMNTVIRDIKSKTFADGTTEKTSLQKEIDTLTEATEAAIPFSDEQKRILYAKREASLFFNSTKDNLVKIINETTNRFDRRNNF